MRSSTWRVCATPSAAVGSSSSTTLGSPSIARAMAMVCRWPPESDATCVRTLGMLTDEPLEQLLDLLLHADLVEPADELAHPRRALLAPEEQVVDDVEVVAEREVLVHGGDAERGRRPVASASMAPACPRRGLTPSSGGTMPAMVLTSVDLPAPLSPTRATTSPARTSKSTSVSAWTAPNRLLIPRSGQQRGRGHGVLPPVGVSSAHWDAAAAVQASLNGARRRSARRSRIRPPRRCPSCCPWSPRRA